MLIVQTRITTPKVKMKYTKGAAEGSKAKWKPTDCSFQYSCTVGCNSVQPKPVTKVLDGSAGSMCTSTRRMEAAGCSETLVSTHQTTRCHNPNDTMSSPFKYFTCCSFLIHGLPSFITFNNAKHSFYTRTNMRRTQYLLSLSLLKHYHIQK
jgi:hypothetical protein